MRRRGPRMVEASFDPEPPAGHQTWDGVPLDAHIRRVQQVLGSLTEAERETATIEFWDRSEYGGECGATVRYQRPESDDERAGRVAKAKAQREERKRRAEWANVIGDIRLAALHVGQGYVAPVAKTDLFTPATIWDNTWVNPKFVPPPHLIDFPANASGAGRRRPEDDDE